MLQGILPPTMNALLQQMSNLGHEQLAALEEVLCLPTSTNPTAEKLKETSEKVNIADGDLRFLLSFISFLYAQTEDLAETEHDTQLQEFIKLNVENGDVQSILNNLRRLLAYRKQYNHALNVARLREGFLPNFQSASTLVDIRGNFEHDERNYLTGAINELIPVTQIRIRTESPNDEVKELVFQIDEKSMDTLIEILGEAKKKIQILRSRIPSIEQNA